MRKYWNWTRSFKPTQRKGVYLDKGQRLVLILFTLVLFCYSCGRKDFRRDYFTVSQVLSGNQLKLVNGYEVILIGVENNPATYDFLKEKLDGKRKVRFVFDSKSPFRKFSSRSKIKLLHAYVVTSDRLCLNSELIKQELSGVQLPQPFLSDSLEAYMAYASNQSRRNLSGRVHIPEDNFSGTARVEKFLVDLIAACDYTDPVTRDYAVRLAGQHAGSFNINQVCVLFTDVLRKWNYVSDPRGSEYFSPASRTISTANLSGDCDDFAVMLYSLVTAIGGRARIIFAYGQNSGHAFTEVDITSFGVDKSSSFIRNFYRHDFMVKSIHYQRESNNSIWLNLDYWAQHPGGQYYDYQSHIVFYPQERRYELFD